MVKYSRCWGYDSEQNISFPSWSLHSQLPFFLPSTIPQPLGTCLLLSSIHRWLEKITKQSLIWGNSGNIQLQKIESWMISGCLARSVPGCVWSSRSLPWRLIFLMICPSSFLNSVLGLFTLAYFTGRIKLKSVQTWVLSPLTSDQMYHSSPSTVCSEFLVSSLFSFPH